MPGPVQAGAGTTTPSTEVCVLDQPPYLSPVEEHTAMEVDTLQWRVIYDRSSVELPGRPAEIGELVASRERARVTPTPPFKPAVVDARVAALPVAVRGVVDQALLIRPSPLLEVLVSMFELYWDNAIPFSPSGSGAEVDTRLPVLPAAGPADESIARHLGLGPRAVQRRVRRLMDRCGARTRFQAGVQAVRRAWSWSCGPSARPASRRSSPLGRRRRGSRPGVRRRPSSPRPRSSP